MKYENRNYLIPTKHRKEVNENILMLIDSQDLQGVTNEEIFNTYTGAGGLHGLEFNRFDNFHTFTEAKKDIEMGQFFTPAHIACKMASLIDLKPNEFICDPTAGAGVFANYFPETNFYGCEIDNKAYKIAKFLYPDSRIELQDIRYWKPGIHFDFIIGNPPFNLSWEINKDTYKSQDFYFTKSAEVLRPAGIIMAIVPKSYCADTMFNKSDIDDLNDKYNFLCQVEIPKDAFKVLGVKDFATKVMCFQRKSEHLKEQPYHTTYSSWEEVENIITLATQEARTLRIKSNAEIRSDVADFEYKVNKYLYEIKTHKLLQPHYAKATELIAKYRNQRCPDNMEFDKWYDHHRIKPGQLLRSLKRIVAKQSIKEIEKIELVKTTYGFKIKAYSKKTKAILKAKETVKYFSFNDIVLEDLQRIQLPKMPNGFYRLIERKKKAYKLQSTIFSEVVPDANISQFMQNFTFKSKGKICNFNAMQLNDLAKISTKEYDILNWQQGCGKTPGGYSWSKYKNRKTFIVSGALSINITWTNFLKENGQKFVVVKSIKDINKIPLADYVLIAHGAMIKYQRFLKKEVKKLSGKISFILDESDEITNHLAKRTRACKSVFQRHAQHKLLTTGTTTRNNIAEIYSQFELLYNNSLNMLCTCEYKYVEDKDKDIIRTENDDINKPFSPRYGNRLFKQCFNPSKTTVFGIKQQNQNIYNEPHLRHLIEKTIITRKFKEIAGDKYVVINKPVYQSATERHVYHTILVESQRLIREYYKSTGNSRQDALLRMIRQIQLLIKATSIPQTFSQYEGSAPPNKTVSILDEIEACNEKVAIGCITIEALEYYTAQVKSRFPGRPVFVIQGDVTFNKRGDIIDTFEKTNAGILICTQQSLKSSVNIPACKKVFIESKQWNIPTIEQFYFRFIRYDSVGVTTVTFFSYERTIEANLWALLMTKEKLNDYIKTLEYRDNDNMYAEFGVDTNILDMIITQEKDSEGAIYLNWGKQSIG